MTNHMLIGDLLKQYLSSGKPIPKMAFYQSTNLRSAVSTLMAQSNVADAATITPEFIDSLAAETLAANRDMAANGSLFNTFQDIADAMAKKMDQSLREVRQVKGDVTDMLTQIKIKEDELAATDADLAASVTGNEEPKDFEVIPWNYLDVIGSQAAIKMVIHGILKISDTSEISLHTVEMAINNLPVNDTTPEAKFEQIELSDDQVAQISEAVAKLNGVTGEIRNQSYMLAQYLNPSFEHFRYMTRNFSALLTNPGDFIMTMDRMREAAVVVAYLTATDIGLSDTQKATLEVTAAIWKKFLCTFGYIALYFRYVLWTDALLVGKSKYNADNWDTFIAQGGSLRKLAMYSDSFHDKEQGVPVPLGGVSASYIIKEVTRLEEEAKEYAAQRASDIDAKRAGLRRLAFIAVLSGYLNAKSDDWYAATSNRKSDANYAASVYDSNPLTRPMADLLYDVIFDCSNVSWMARRLYNRLSQEYLKHMSSTESFDEALAESVDALVYADICSDFLVQELLQIG